jgi:hypothetical protein
MHSRIAAYVTRYTVEKVERKPRKSASSEITPCSVEISLEESTEGREFLRYEGLDTKEVLGFAGDGGCTLL